MQEPGYGYRVFPRTHWQHDCTVYRHHGPFSLLIGLYTHTHTHTQLYSPFEKAAQLYTKNESENLTNQQHETLKKRYLVQSTQ